MAFSETKISEYSKSEYVGHVPRHIKAMGELKGPYGKMMLMMSFTTERDVVTDIGIKTSDHCAPTLKAAAAVACEKAKGKAVIAMELISPDDILTALSDQTEVDDGEYYIALMVVMVIKNTLSSYASYRSAENNDR